MGGADGCVFVMYAFEQGTFTAVSVVCMRASEDAPAVARQFRCQLWWVEGGRTKAPVFSFRVTSSDGSRLPVDPGLFLTVPDELPAQATLMIRIDKDSELPTQAALMIRSDQDGDEATDSSDEDGGPETSTGHQ